MKVLDMTAIAISHGLISGIAWAWELIVRDSTFDSYLPAGVQGNVQGD
jgi:hypothetical protein